MARMPGAPDGVRATVWTEGKTDWKHIKSAFQRLDLGADIDFHEFEDQDMGDRTLCSKCRTASETPHPFPIIFVFDSDNPELVKEITDVGMGYKDWGNNVFSLAIPLPRHRQDHEHISIEFYYSDEELRTPDAHGRRLYMTSEFDEVSGTHLDDPSIHVGNKRKLKQPKGRQGPSILDSEVYRGKENIALTKSAFADYVYQGIEPYSSFQVDAFRAILDLIHQIIEASTPKIQLFHPNLTESTLFMQDDRDVPTTCLHIVDYAIDLVRMACYLFVVAAIRYYEDEFTGSPRSNNKDKCRSIRDGITKDFRLPPLSKIARLTQQCIYLVGNDAAPRLLEMKRQLETGHETGALAPLLADLQSLFPPEGEKKKRYRRYNPSTRLSLARQIIVDLAMYEDKVDQLSEILAARSDIQISDEVWLDALKYLASLLQPLLSSEDTFVLKTLDQVNRASETYTVCVTTYQDGKKQVGVEQIEFDELEEWQDSSSALIIRTQDGEGLPIDLFPFLVIKDDHLFAYARTRARGYEYRSLFGDEVTVISTKRKFNHSVFGSSFWGDQQALFWTEVLPSVNQLNGIRANIPTEGFDQFVGRKRQIKKVLEEVIEIPNQNGIVYGVGGVGKTALMLAISQLLYDEQDRNKVLYDNIVWVSAKGDYYNYALDLVEKRSKQFDSLDTVLTAILAFFEYEDAEEYDHVEKRDLVLEILDNHRVLLILDNFETIPRREADGIVRFFSIDAKQRLRKKPDYFKVIVTSRRQIPCGFHQIELSGLDLRESRQLMSLLRQQYRNCPFELTPQQEEELHEASRGIPIIIKHAFGQVYEHNRSLDSVLRGLRSAGNEVVHFSFKETLGLLANDQSQLDVILLLEIVNYPLMARQIADILAVTEQEIDGILPDLTSYQCITRSNIGGEEKYLINEDVRFFTRGLAQEHADRVASLRQEFSRNLPLEKQMDYTAEELSIAGMFNQYLMDGQALEAEDFIKDQLQANPESVLLNYHYAKYLKENKQDLDGATAILESIRATSRNHASVLLLLISCYTSLAIPNFSAASPYVNELETTVQLDDDLHLEIARFYTNWSTSIKLKRELDPLKERIRIQRYKDLADRGISHLKEINHHAHETYYLLAQCHFNQWDYDLALDFIRQAVASVADGRYNYFEGVILKKRDQYSRKGRALNSGYPYEDYQEVDNSWQY